MRLSLMQKISLALFGRARVGLRTREGWRGSIMHYAIKCPKHGVVVTYPTGFKGVLKCPKCD